MPRTNPIHNPDYFLLLSMVSNNLDTNKKIIKEWREFNKNKLQGGLTPSNLSMKLKWLTDNNFLKKIGQSSSTRYELNYSEIVKYSFSFLLEREKLLTKINAENDLDFYCNTLKKYLDYVYLDSLFSTKTIYKVLNDWIVGIGLGFNSKVGNKKNIPKEYTKKHRKEFLDCCLVYVIENHYDLVYAGLSLFSS